MWSRMIRLCKSPVGIHLETRAFLESVHALGPHIDNGLWEIIISTIIIFNACNTALFQT